MGEVVDVRQQADDQVDGYQGQQSDKDRCLKGEREKEEENARVGDTTSSSR